jgi:hypothetical protein
MEVPRRDEHTLPTEAGFLLLRSIRATRTPSNPVSRWIMYIFSEESLKFNLSTEFDGLAFPLSQSCGTFLTRIGATVEA